jgi:hypothetical protein
VGHRLLSPSQPPTHQQPTITLFAGPYFSRYLEDSSEQLGSASEVRNVLEEVQIEVIKNSLHKLYLEDFYRLCQVPTYVCLVCLSVCLGYLSDRSACLLACLLACLPVGSGCFVRDRQTRLCWVVYGQTDRVVT